MQIGGASPGDVCVGGCMQNDRWPPPWPEKSPMLASVQGDLGTSTVARRMRQLFGLRDGAVRQDVLAATDMDANSGDGDIAA